MGLVLCQHHGPSGLADACFHLVGAVAARAPLPPFAAYLLKIQAEVGITQRYRFCLRSCVRDLGLPLPPRPLEEEELEGTPSGCTCGACLDELQRATDANVLAPAPAPTGPWRCTWCDILRDGGSYGAVLRSTEGEVVSLFLEVLPWDHPRDIAYGALFLSPGDRPEAMVQRLEPGSGEERRWLNALGQDVSALDAEGRSRLGQLIAELLPRR